MRDEFYIFAHEVEHLLQFVDASNTENPSEVRFIIKKLREKIAASRESHNKYLEKQDSDKPALESERPAS